MRIFIASLLGTLLVTGCIFPSFDNMQNGSKKDGDDETNPAPTSTGETVKRSELATDATGGDASAASSSPDASSPAVDASVDATVAAPPPGAGKVACGSSDCTVAANTYCCAGYASPSASCRNNDSFDDVFGCANGIAHALYCDEKADCPTGQVCCDTDQGSGTVAKCATSCGGRVLCKQDSDCPTGKKCTGSLDSDVPNKVCQ